MAAYSSDSGTLIASADCQTADRHPGTGNALCAKENTRSIPHLMYGSPDNLQEYQGGRDFATLKNFIESHKTPGSNQDPPGNVHAGTCPMSDDSASVVV